MARADAARPEAEDGEAGWAAAPCADRAPPWCCTTASVSYTHLGGVIKTLLDRKLIAEAGRKNVIGKPILYKTTKEFLIQFGLKDLAELPSLCLLYTSRCV